MKKLLSPLWFAFKFLTILPFPFEGEAEGASGYFSLIGLFIGATLFLGEYLFTFFMPPFFREALLLLILVGITGGLHLDGLADTFDAIFSAESPHEILKIMKDERVGTFGATAIFFSLLLKVSLLTALSVAHRTSFFLFPAVSRFATTLTCYLFPSAKEEGLGRLFLSLTTLKDVITGALIVLVPGVFVGRIQFLIPFSGTVLITFLTARFFSKKTGGLTGDHLGALIEIGEIVCLFFFVLIQQYLLNFSGKIFP